MVDFQNHRCFSLRCLSKDVIPTRVRLKSTIRTPKAKYVIRRVERALLNERIRSINNSITMFKLLRDTCINQLENILDKEIMEECREFIEIRRERRHLSTLDRHLSKFKRLCHDNTGGRSSPFHGIHGESGCTTCITTSTGTTAEDDHQIQHQETQTHTISDNWVRNLSKTPLTEAQEHLLGHGPNFVLVFKEPPACKYIVATEKACQNLLQGKVEELRGEIKQLLMEKHTIKPNIHKEEYQALKQLKKDNTRMVLTVDKGVSMVVMDREEYIQKSEELLNQPSYKILQADPTTKYKNKLISLLKSIKSEGGKDENTYKRLYPTGATPPKYYGLPKVHKLWMALRPIISNIGSVTYTTAKELSRILKPLVGRSPHHVMNNLDFLESIRGIQLQPEECMLSYDVEALFTSVPIESAISIIKKHLEEDKELHQRTAMSVNQITCLLKFCLNTTYFTFQGKINGQVKGAAMGSSLSPIVANLFMEDLETKALATAPSTPKIWKRFVDDTFTIIQKADKDAFLDHINSIDVNIHFTSEDPKEDGSIPFLDMLIIPDEVRQTQHQCIQKAN